MYSRYFPRVYANQELDAVSREAGGLLWSAYEVICTPPCHSTSSESHFQVICSRISALPLTNIVSLMKGFGTDEVAVHTIG